MKTKTILVAALMAMTALAAAPMANADLNHRTFITVRGSVDLGDGWGMYDPAPPAATDYCIAVLGIEIPLLLVNFYYATGRLATNFNVDESDNLGVDQNLTTLGSPAGDCLGVFPPAGQHVVVDFFRVVGGNSFSDDGIIGGNQLPVDLTKVDLTFEYCAITNSGINGAGFDDPSFTDGTNITDATALADDIVLDAATLDDGDGAATVTCGTSLGGSSDLGDTSDWNIALLLNRAVFRNHTVWVTEGTQGFASEAGDYLDNQPAPGTSFVANGCLEMNLTHVITGVAGIESDASHFTVLDPAVSNTALEWGLLTRHWDSLDGDSGCGDGVVD